MKLQAHRFEQRGLLHVEVMFEERMVHFIVLHLGLISGSRVRQVEQMIRFIKRQIPDKDALVIAGDFNDWNPTQTYFTKHASGMWYAALPLLLPGTYQYKLVVDGERWLEDPSNGLKAEDNHGGFNSVLHIAE